MFLKPDQEHIRELLAETITLLCCNGLHFKSEFSIDALIGITLDQNEVFLVSIKKTFQSAETGITKELESQSVVGRESCTSWDLNDLGSSDVAKKLRNSSKERKIQLDESDKMSTQEHANNMSKTFESRDSKRPSNKRKHRTPSKFCLGQNELSGSILLEEIAYGNSAKRLTFNAPENSMNCINTEDSIEYLDGHFTEMQELNKSEDLEISRVSRTGESAKICESNKAAKFKNHNEYDLVHIKQEPVEKSLLPANRTVHCSNSKLCSNASPGRNSCSFLSSVYPSDSFYLQLQDSIPGCSSWNVHKSSDMTQLSYASRNRWHLEPFEAQSAEKEIDEPPDLTALEISYARDILSISGSFINIGSVKAFHRNLRQLSHEGLSSLLKKMSLPKNSCYCIGILCTDGVSRVFYKCPPVLLRSEAVAFYDLNVSAYASAFNGHIKVSRRVLDPFEWIDRLSKFSPYVADKVEAI